MSKSVRAQQRAAELHAAQRPRWALALGVAGVVVIIALAAAVVVSLTRDSQTQPPQAGAPASGPTAADFSLQTLEGEKFSLADHRGRVVVVEFLAPGCPSCAADLAGLSKAAEQKPDVTLLIADVSDADPDTLRDFYRGEYDVPPAVMIAPDIGFKVAKSFGSSALGDTVVITPGGEVGWKGRWAGDEKQLLARIGQVARS